MPHEKFREILGRWVSDGVIQRTIGKWLNAGVMEAENVYYPEKETPQGGSNITLVKAVGKVRYETNIHYIFDTRKIIHTIYGVHSKNTFPIASLSNIYLYEVLDKWFAETVKPLMKMQTFLVRYADNALIRCEKKEGAGRIMKVLAPPGCQIRADRTPGEDKISPKRRETAAREV
jgi:hypothetical protein